MIRTYKWAAVLSVSAVLAAGSAMMASAASGWSEEDGSWAYLDSSGNRVTNEWKKSGDQWYYLGSDGYIVTDSWVEDTYYVDENGVMLKNQWVYMEEGEESPSSEDEGWFYLGSAGKAVTDSWTQIDGNYYCFDDDGRMFTGWHYDDDNVYYLGEDGSRKTGWLCLEYDEDDEPEEGDTGTAGTAGDDAKWFYFQASGKMVKADEETYVVKSINSSKYYFDENGVMLTGWAAIEDEAETGDSTGISRFRYFGDENDGAMAKGWKYLTEHPTDSDDSEVITVSGNDKPDDGEGYWYYFESDGTPKYLSSTASTISAAVGKVGSDSYFFDEYGCMRTGLIGLEFDGTVYAAYFGTSEDDAKMRTGKQTSVYDGNGEKGTYYFNSSGSYKGGGITGVKDDYLYYEGKLVKADDDSDFQVFEVNGKFYLVNESGKVQTSSKYYQVDGDYRYQYSGGTIYVVDDDKEVIGEVDSGDCAVLPEVIYDLYYAQ